MVLAYFTPDVALPVASALAAVLGFVLMVGRAPFRLIARAFRSGSGRRKTGDGPGPG